MNFKVSKRIFYNALQVVSRAISANSPLPSLSGIKIEVNDDHIVLTGSDSDISIQKILNNDEEDLNLVVKETGSIVIEAKYILEIVRKIDADEINFEIIDGSLTKISGLSAEYKINGMRSSDYPSIDFSKPGQQFDIDADVLMKVISQTSFATSDKETRPVLTGVNFKCKDKVLECVATDSYRLARKFIELESDNTFNITIPAKSLNEIVKTIDKDSKVNVCVSDKKAQFWIGNTLIQTRLIDGSYPETERLVPTEFLHEMIVDSRDILNAIDRASFIKNEGISIVKLSADSKEVVISSKSQEVGSSTEKLNVISYSGNPIEISFSGRYVFEAIRTLATTTVKIQFSGEMKPFVIRNTEDDSILQLVLPVRTYS
ncbi:DNA polymerase III subunit beta [Anaerorhabdus sp.]|uniref:DNA polymerase III subunit beta n=1 Tax=Anaerorhabdus sp. TaxID=1872524 RepID=UPI002B21FBBB|nr:DNA polymerase III subunit beta [Anaerorhabdus sp.]MEA4875549.1 DNA polymerase III subunit beta [Anaerorhabdus sp.]